MFNEALAKIAVNAQHGGTTDIGKFIFTLHTHTLIQSLLASNLINKFYATSQIEFQIENIAI